MAQTIEIEQLVRDLNDPRNQSSPEVINVLQRRIQQLQRENAAWTWGMSLLEHGDAVMRFYGALTLTIKINADWDTDHIGEDRGLIEQLLQGLVSNYVRLISMPDVPFVIQKLCSTLVAFFQQPQSAWAMPVRHLVGCTVAHRYIPEANIPTLTDSLSSNASISGTQLKYMLMFLITLTEQHNTIGESLVEQAIHLKMSDNLPDMLRLSHFIFTSLSRSVSGLRTDFASCHLTIQYEPTQLLDMTKMILQLLPLWSKDPKLRLTSKQDPVLVSNSVLYADMLRLLPQFFQQQALAASVLQCLTAIEESSHRLVETALPKYEESIINSTQAAVWMDQLISGDFDPDAVAYVNFLEACIGQVDVTSPAYLKEPFYIEILKQIRKLLQCEGSPGIEDAVCQVALEILTNVTEGFSDWPEPDLYTDSMKELIMSACSDCVKKVCIPIEEMNIKSQTWDADDRAKFQDFRYDVQDYLQIAFSVLGDELINEITKIVIRSEPPNEWNNFEAGLFSFVSFSDIFHNDDEKCDQYVSAVMSCQIWQAGINATMDVPDRTRQMMIKVIGENTGFLQRHTGSLVHILNFLFLSLHLESSATAASRAIFTLCDSQRSMLVEALPQFLISLRSTSSIDPDARNRIFAGVGAIIQALPSEADKIQPLDQILQRLTQAEFDDSQATAMTQSDTALRAVETLQTLAAFGKGLRAPSEGSNEQQHAIQSDRNFWLTGLGSRVQQQIIEIHQTLYDRCGGRQSASFTEAACNLLRTGFTEQHPSPFKLSDDDAIEILIRYMQPPCSHPDQVMSTATAYLASVARTDPNNQFDKILTTSIHLLNERFQMSHSFDNAHTANSTALPSESDTDFITATLNLYTRLLPKWCTILFQHPSSSEILDLLVKVALRLLSDSDTLPRRTAATFFATLIDISTSPRLTSDASAHQSYSHILATQLPRILASTLHLIGGVCARSDIDVLTETLKKSAWKQPLMTNRILKEAMKAESGVLSEKAIKSTREQQRMRFVVQLVDLYRGQGSGPNNVAKELWIACRGREFEYVT